MKKRIYILHALFIGMCCSLAARQVPEDPISLEVNASLWRPFQKAFEARDWELFNSLHTDDVMRVSSWGMSVGEEYKQSIRDHYSKRSEDHRTIHFRFEVRKYSGDWDTKWVTTT